MAETKRVCSDDEFSSTLAEALTNFKYNYLKAVQIECVICLREDVLAVVPSGCGKSLIYQTIREMLECFQNKATRCHSLLVEALFLWLTERL